MNSKKHTNPRNQNQLRIIGGKWRGRKLSFPNTEGLRPTGDRIRETLFNWLAPFIESANVIDLYAGSGALGFESASRFAKQVYLVEKNKQVASHLKNTIELLDSCETQLHHTSAVTFLDNWAGEPFEIVFVDPPFGQNLLITTVAALTRPGVLKSNALIYMETPLEEGLPPLPDSWQCFKQKTTGNVRYSLFTSN